MKKIFLLFLIAGFASTKVDAKETVTFPSLDGLTITADLYHVNDDFPVILLCHQARFSRGEYLKIAGKLNEAGFNCLAIDQRSGFESNQVENETAKLAMERGLSAAYLDAEQDMIAGVNYLENRYGRKVILWGSSYSASLALRIAKTNANVSAAIAFSPGEYFPNQFVLAEEIQGLEKPVFLTSSQREAESVATLAEGINSKVKHQFIPEEKGVHGSRALWQDNASNSAYWKALSEFLNKLK